MKKLTFLFLFQNKPSSNSSIPFSSFSSPTLNLLTFHFAVLTPMTVTKEHGFMETTRCVFVCYYTWGSDDAKPSNVHVGAGTDGLGCFFVAFGTGWKKFGHGSKNFGRAALVCISNQ